MSQARIDDYWVERSLIRLRVNPDNLRTDCVPSPVETRSGKQGCHHLTYSVVVQNVHDFMININKDS